MHGIALAEAYVACVFHPEKAKVSLLILLITLWIFQSAISICFMNDEVLHRQGVMMDKSPELSTGLVLKDRFANYLLRNDLEFKELT